MWCALTAFQRQPHTHIITFSEHVLLNDLNLIWSNVLSSLDIWFQEGWSPTLKLRETKRKREKTDAGLPHTTLGKPSAEFVPRWPRIAALSPVYQMPSIFLTCHSHKGYFLVIHHCSLQNSTLTLSLCKSGHWGLGPHILLDPSCRKNALPLWEIKQPAKSNWSLGGTEHQHQHPPKTTHLETPDRIEQNRIDNKDIYVVMMSEPLQNCPTWHRSCYFSASE